MSATLTVEVAPSGNIRVMCGESVFAVVGNHDDAAHIVKCVNAHDELLSYAKGMAEGDCTYGDGCPGLRSNPRHGPCHCCLAREALKKAGAL